MKIVQVFKTDVQDQQVARHIVLFLKQSFSHCRINFDLDDCDKVLRIESLLGPVQETAIQLVMAGYGYDCEPLRD
ncbi:MAG TPA: hypothetical protein VNS58_23700 [Puia sp.]|jgi:hypothetical protein|nr:hypothetical protein [Puia sp.]